jgi:hypothetical protein
MVEPSFASRASQALSTGAEMIMPGITTVARGITQAFTPENLGRGAEAMGNDLTGGFQGVNPTAMQEAVGQSVGILRPMFPGSDKLVVDVDGVMEPAEKYTSDRFATTSIDGVTYVIPRTAKDSAGKSVEEGPAASAGRVLGYAIPGVHGSAAPAAAAKPATPAMEAATAATDLGITPSFGMSGNSKIAAAGEQFAPTAGPFKRDAARATEEMGAAATKLADRAGPGVTPFEAGEALQHGGGVYVQEARDFQGKLFEAVDKAIPKETRIGTPDTVAFLQGEIDKLAATPNIAKSFKHGELEGWLDDLSGVDPKAAKAAPAATGPKRPTSVLEAMGAFGVKDPGGDLASMGVTDWDKARPFRKNVLRADGLSPDIAAKKLWEAGFFRDMPEAHQMMRAEQGLEPEPNLVDAMHRAVDDEMAGDFHFTAQDQSAGWEWKEAAERGAVPPDGAELGASADVAGGLSWEAARALRSKIGEALRDTGPGTERTMARGTLKAIYGRLTQDLEAAAKAQGPEAVYAWGRAQKFTKASEDRIRDTFSKILKADTPERAYSILTGMTAEGTGAANITAVKRVFNSIPPEDQAVVAGTIIRRLGRAAPGGQDAAGGAWSAATFLTNWNKMAPEARAVIGRSGLDETVGEGLTKLAKVAEQAKAAGLDRNFSNTAGTGSQIALWSAITSALFTGHPLIAGGIAAGATAANISARFLTNPKALHALTRYVATGGSTEALQRIAKGQGVPAEIATEAATILRLGLSETASPQSQPREPALAFGSPRP